VKRRNPMVDTSLKKKDLKRFREILLSKKSELLHNAQKTLTEDMTLDADDLPDEMDLASSEYLQSFTFRLRGREKTFLKKIDHALKKIDEGNFGICEECEEPISLKRLEARPETTLCIRCKEDQERIEKAYG
jgi:DnaK suppressor protein